MTCLQHIKNNIKQKEKNKKKQVTFHHANTHVPETTFREHTTFFFTMFTLTIATVCLMPIAEAITKYSGLVFWTLTTAYIITTATYIKMKKVEAKANQKETHKTQEKTTK